MSSHRSRLSNALVILVTCVMILAVTLSTNAQSSGSRPIPSTDYMIDNASYRDASTMRPTVPQNAGTWSATSLINAPEQKQRHSTVWTGSEMIIWGGYAYPTTFNTGVRYKPSDNIWQSVTTTGAPSARENHLAVWNGREMLIWGGSVWIYPNRIVYNDGGCYSPLTDSWRSITTTGAPPASTSDTASALWTGEEMIVWETSGAGARYNPRLDQWKPITTTGAPTPGSIGHTVWTGQEMIVYYTDSNFNALTGGRYDPRTDSWRSISMANAPYIGWHAATVWTGQEAVFFGGDVGFISRAGANSGGRYNPVTDTWTLLPWSPFLEHAVASQAVWTGSDVVFVGTNDDSIVAHGTNVARYNLSASNWIAIAPPPCLLGTLIWTGSELLLWGNGGNSCLPPDNAARRFTIPFRTTQLFDADADTYIAQGHATESFGSDPLMFSGYDPQYKYYTERMLLHFPIGIPAHTSLEQATAYLYMYAYNTGAAPMTISAHRATGSWNENSTWQSSANNFDATPSSAVSAGTTFGWYGWDATSTARKWLSGTPNYGLIFNGNMSGNRNERVFLAREAGADVAPFLAVTYTDPAYAADSTPPTAGILGLAAVQDYRNALAVEWSGYDQGRGINNFDVQVRDESTGIWTDWYSWAIGRSASFSGETGHTYCFRVRTRDYAGNLGNWSTDDRCTTFYAYSIAGQIVDHRHAPVANATLQAHPAALTTTVNSLSGQYTLYFADDQPRAITVTQPVYSAPPVASIVITATDHYDFVLQPTDNVVSNSNFESDLADWVAGGTVPISITDLSHSGSRAVAFNPELTSTAGIASVTQALALPTADAPQILSIMYNLTTTSPLSNSQLAVTLATTDTAVTIWSTSTSCVIWCHAWVDVSPWSGQPVTLTISLDQASGEKLQATVDEVVLGSWQTPIIEQVTPARIDAHVSTVITLTGQNFLVEPLNSDYITVPTVLLNMTPIATHWISTTTLTATVPVTIPFGLYTVWVSNPGDFRSALPDSLRVGYAVILPLIAKNQ